MRCGGGDLVCWWGLCRCDWLGCGRDVGGFAHLAGNVMMKVVLAGVGVRMAVGNWNGGTCRLDLGGGCGCVQCVGTLGCVGW